MTGRRRWWVVCAVLAAYLLGLVAVMTWTRANDTATATGGPPPSVVPVPEISTGGMARLTLPKNPRVLLIGDSFAQGLGADPAHDGFAYRIGGLLDWQVEVDGLGSTGYIATGPRNSGNYRTRLAKADGGPYDLIVLQGGSNDERKPIAELRSAADLTVTAVHDKFPSAQVMMMGPISLWGSTTEARKTANAVLARYAREHQIPYVNPIYENWFVSGDHTTYVDAVKGYPNNLGHQRLAQLFVDDVRKFTKPAGE